ncbi:MAG TPA: EamA family transporter [Candidatus Acidoferrales bacterium]|nr:EamA family transporter [Candidatus Acidoferrales bacterium]
MLERLRHPFVFYSLILLMVLSWSFNFVIGKITLRYIDPFTLTSFRIILSALAMLPVYIAMPERSRLNRKDLWNFIVLGFFGMLINRGLFTIGLDYTTAGHSALIVAAGPILILVLAQMHGLEGTTWQKITGMTLCVIGVTVLVGGDDLHLHGKAWAGDLITLGGTIGFAIYTVLAKKVARQYDTISMNTFCNLAGAILVLPLALRQSVHLQWSSVGWVGWAGLAYMVLISSVAAYLIYFWALRYVNATRLATFTYIEPPLATLLGVILLGEKLTNLLLLGGGLILAGVYLAEFAMSSAEAPPDTAGA